jgi:hypothetical protein
MMIFNFWPKAKVFCRFCGKEMQEITIGVPIGDQAHPLCRGTAIAEEAMRELRQALADAKKESCQP